MLPPPRTGTLLTNQLEPLPDYSFDASFYSTSSICTNVFTNYPHKLIIYLFMIFIQDWKYACLFSGRNLCICKEHYGNVATTKYRSTMALPDCSFDASLYTTNPVRTHYPSPHLIIYLFMIFVLLLISNLLFCLI